MRGLLTRADAEAFLKDVGPFAVAIWDFDGVIVDSEPSQANAYRAVLARRGHQPAGGFFEALFGHSDEEIWSHLKQTYRIGDDIAALRLERIGEVLATLVDSPPNWFVDPILSCLESARTPSIVLSSGNREVIFPYLDTWRLDERFDKVLCGPVAQGGITKEETLGTILSRVSKALVIEDSAHYLRLARSLGAQTVAVMHDLNATHSLDADARLRPVAPFDQ
jgi:beta-phosphoglucomutase-like phosphatase (HAD superfamily)